MRVSIDIDVLVSSVGRVVAGSSVVVGLTVRECVCHTFLVITLNHVFTVCIATCTEVCTLIFRNRVVIASLNKRAYQAWH